MVVLLLKAMVLARDLCLLEITTKVISARLAITEDQMVIASLADPVVVLRKIISPKILGILKTLITVDQMAARQDIFVDLMVSVYRQIIADPMAARQDMFVDPMVSVYLQIIVGLMGVLQDIFVDLTVSVIQQIAAVLMVVHLVTTVDQTASVFHAHQADALQT